MKHVALIKSAAHPAVHVLIFLLLGLSMSSVKIMEKPEVCFHCLICGGFSMKGTSGVIFE